MRSMRSMRSMHQANPVTTVTTENAVMTRKIKISLALALTMLAACTTTGKAPSSSSKTQLPVVQQAGQADPVVASRDRQYYLDLRQAKGILSRIDGSLATGEAQAAVDLSRNYLAKNPGDARALTALAAALALTRRYDLASYYATLAERAQPGNPAALNIKGVARMLMPKARMADFQAAMSYFQQAFDADQGQIAPGLNLGNLYLETGNPKAAVAIFKRTADRCGDCVAAMMGYGVASSRSRDFGAAVKAFETVLDRSAKHPGALYNLALVYKNGYNKPKQAETYLDMLLNESKTKDVAMRERAQTVLRMMKGEASKEERVLAKDDQEEDPQTAPVSDTDDAEMLMKSSDFGEE